METITQLQRIIEFVPAYDRRDKDPNKNYGIHCVAMYMTVKGNNGAISFCVFTGWYLPQNDVKDITGSGASICYHSTKPKYEEQTGLESCKYLPGKLCYCDCTYIQADDLFDQFVSQEDEVVWKDLEDRYSFLPAAGD